MRRFISTLLLFLLAQLPLAAATRAPGGPTHPGVKKEDTRRSGMMVNLRDQPIIEFFSYTKQTFALTIFNEKNELVYFEISLAQKGENRIKMASKRFKESIYLVIVELSDGSTLIRKSDFSEKK